MKISIDRRVKMVPIMEINAGDEVNVGGFDYVVENILPCRKGSYSDAYGIRLVMSSYKHGQLVRKVDSVFSIDSILVFLPKGDSVVVECSYRELEECFPKIKLMTGEEKCNRCEQFGPNGLTDYPCKRIPSRNCPWFIKISDKKYKKILADRVKRIKENEELKQEMMKDQDLIEEVKQNTKRLIQ